MAPLCTLHTTCDSVLSLSRSSTGALLLEWMVALWLHRTACRSVMCLSTLCSTWMAVWVHRRWRWADSQRATCRGGTDIEPSALLQTSRGWRSLQSLLPSMSVGLQWAGWLVMRPASKKNEFDTD